MKPSMMVWALGVALPLCGILAEEPAKDDKSALSHPIEITQGYGAAKWGMSVEDFRKAYPQAKMEQDIPEDIWRKIMAIQIFTLDDGFKSLSFLFLRGSLMQVNLSLKEHFPNDYRQGDSWSQSIIADINRQFSFAKDSGVTVNTQIQDANFPGALPQRPPMIPTQKRALRTAPTPVPGASNPPAPENTNEPRPVLPPLPPKPTPPAPPTYVISIQLEQHKLWESISAEFKHLTDAAQEKATQQAISKLAPPM